MSDDYACGGSRNKKSDKARAKRDKSPYKTGGRFRASKIDDTDNSSKKVINVKKKKNKKKQLEARKRK